MKAFTRIALSFGIGAALVVASVPALAQEYFTHRGTNARTGIHNAPLATNNPGRSFLRWWDPIFNLQQVVDNAGAVPGGTPGASWLIPAGREASLFVDPANAADPHYLFATTVASRAGSDGTVAQTGTAANFAWTLGTTAGVDYALAINVPMGPTDTDPGAGVTLRYPQRYYVVRIEGVVGGPIVQLIDTFAVGGGWVRLGRNNLPVDDVFTASGGAIVIRLFNTIPRDENGNLTSDPGTTVVYADAVRAQTAGDTVLGSYTASPIVAELKTGAPAHPWRLVASRNEPLSVQDGSIIRTVSLGVTTSYYHDGQAAVPNGTVRGNRVWSFPVARPFNDDETERETYARQKRDWALARINQDVTRDNLSAGVTVVGGWATANSSPGPSGFKGTDYLSAVALALETGSVTYSPKLNDGDHEIWVWLPGDPAGTTYARGARYVVSEGGFQTTIDLDQTQAGGWVRLATASKRLFRHTTGVAELTVKLTNVSTAAGDANSGRLIYADMLRFRSTADLRVTSTPTMLQVPVKLPNGNTVNRDVVIVATENGRIYCLDAAGTEANGRTRVYWTYPSETGGSDPNQVAGLDGPDGIAEMPIGFDISSALVQNIGGQRRLFIASKNGRVYSLDMAGRGDGTTTRLWSYPDDYPSAAVNSTLGPITGSLTYFQTSAGRRILVPTRQGRMYCLDADGNTTTKTTTVTWAFPAVNQPTIGAITMTPAVQGTAVLFGTAVQSGAGRFYSVNVNTGAMNWEFAGQVGVPTLDFASSSPAVATAAALGGGMPATVFVANLNGYVYALQLANGSVLWRSNEIGATAQGSLSVLYQDVFSIAGTRLNSPTVMVPTVDGRFVSLFARTADLNQAGLSDGFSRRAWEYRAEGQSLVASVAVGGRLPVEANCWLYGADVAGYLYAFHNIDSQITDGEPPGSDVLVENDPTSTELDDIARNARVRFIVPEDYDKILEGLRDNSLTQAQVQAAREATRRSFEYGETIYILVDNLPDPASLASGRNYQIDFQFTAPGSASQITRTAPQAIPSGNPPDATSHIALRTFPLMGTGGNALAPGAGTMISRVTMTGGTTATAEIDAPLARSFNLANPLGVIVRRDAVTLESIGNSIDATLPENQSNGNIGGPVGGIQGSFGPDGNHPGDQISHGNTGVTVVQVVDRSLMRLLLGDNQGLQQVRFSVADLGWLGAAASVVKPLDPSIYPNFEDLPTLFPNVSLDYPDMRRDRMNFTRDTFGSVDNPLYGATSLTPPVVDAADLAAYQGIGYNTQLVRTLVPTVVDVQVDVPRFQPPSLQGYRGLNSVYVDNPGAGRDQTTGAPREAFREFNLFANVAVDERLSVGTPTVDLGSMASGTGFVPQAPWDAGSNFSPFNAAFAELFKSFSVFNDGNVNLQNVRVAKSVAGSPVRLEGDAQHELSWIDAVWGTGPTRGQHLWSSIDARFLKTENGNRAMLQKARVSDPTPSRLSVNPIRRTNANLGVTASTPLFDPAELPTGDPVVGVTAPVGAPTGPYLSRIFAIEDTGTDENLLPDTMAYSDPGFLLKFNVRETQATNRGNGFGAPMMDDLQTDADRFLWSNNQPAIFRSATGSLVAAWSSNRPIFAPTGANRQPATAVTTEQTRLYFSVLRGATPTATPGASPLRDLNGFQPSGTNDPNTGRERWWRHAIGPYPNVDDASLSAMFGLQPTEQVRKDANGNPLVRFSSPSFPANGSINPNTGAENRSVSFAFVGEVQIVNDRGESSTVSRVLTASLSLGVGGAITASIPQGIGDSPRAQKSRPSVVQTSGVATVFFAASQDGQPQLIWASRTSSGFLNQSINAGNGFESIGSPSAVYRRYQNSTPIVELSFAAKQRGRANTEIFLARLTANAVGAPTGNNPVRTFPNRIERLELDVASGIYWAVGSEWLRGETAIDLLRGDSATSILVPGTRNLEPTTGVVSYDCTLGGKVYLDTQNGSVRFSGALIPRGMTLLVRYSPRFLRISGGVGANYRNPALMFDSRLTGEYSYWADWNNNPIPFGDTSNAARNDRLIIGYTRTSVTGGDETRPYLRTFRFGMQLPTAIQTDQNGAITGPFEIRVVPDPNVPASTQALPAGTYFQVDPVSGRIYFTSEMEDVHIRVTYRGVDENGAPYPSSIVYPQVSETQVAVGLISELGEGAMPIERPASESGLALALDPFNSPTLRRPGLIWTFWTSTRGGTPDMFFQTLTPRFTPFRTGN